MLYTCLGITAKETTTQQLSLDILLVTIETVKVVEDRPYVHNRRDYLKNGRCFCGLCGKYVEVHCQWEYITKNPNTILDAYHAFMLVGYAL